MLCVEEVVAVGDDEEAVGVDEGEEDAAEDAVACEECLGLDEEELEEVAGDGELELVDRVEAGLEGAADVGVGREDGEREGAEGADDVDGRLEGLDEGAEAVAGEVVEERRLDKLERDGGRAVNKRHESAGEQPIGALRARPGAV